MFITFLTALRTSSSLFHSSSRFSVSKHVLIKKSLYCASIINVHTWDALELAPMCVPPCICPNMPPHATLSHPLYHQLKMSEHLIDFYFVVLTNSESNSQKEKNIGMSIWIIKVRQIITFDIKIFNLLTNSHCFHSVCYYKHGCGVMSLPSTSFIEKRKLPKIAIFQLVLSPNVPRLPYNLTISAKRSIFLSFVTLPKINSDSIPKKYLHRRLANGVRNSKVFFQ